MLLPGLDNHTMGTIFEELLRRFNEDYNQGAGEQFTPRDIVEMMAELVFRPIKDRIGDGTYLLYDDACGTGGMLTVGEAKLLDLARKQGKKTEIHLDGQELNTETYAICKADLLLKGEGEEARNIAFGSTLSADLHGRNGLKFDFMMANPPFGTTWKIDLAAMDVNDPRFVVEHARLPRKDDRLRLFRDQDRVTQFLFAELPEKISANGRVQNALRNSDDQNARIEHNRAVDDELLGSLSDHTDLYALYNTDKAFKAWLQDRLYAVAKRGSPPSAALP